MTQESKKKKHLGNILLSIFVIIVILIAIIAAIRYLIHTSKYQETNDAQVEAYINPISARVGGYIKKIYFEEHQLVNAGDTLIIIDDREYKTKVAEAEAAVEDVEAQLLVLKASINTAHTGTFVNQDQINAAKARLWEKQQDMKRYKNLVKEEAATMQEYEAVKSKYDVASSDYNGTRNSLKTNNSKVVELQAREGLLLAELKIKKAQLELANINLSYTVIIAPYAGRLGRKTIQEGQQIQMGQSLVPIIDESNKWIAANFKETQIENMYEGQSVLIKIDGYDNKTYKGEIESISGSTGSKFSLLPPDNSTGNFVKIIQRIPVKIRFLNQEDTKQIKAGMNVIVSVKNKE